MTVTVYRSSDTAAPILTGMAGSLLSVLDACLVNGYGTQTAAGWTKPFNNSGNIGCYQNSTVNGTGCYLSVNDNGPGAGGAVEARMTGFQTMSALNTGTGQFPTVWQLNIGIGSVVCRKSATASTIVRAWTLIADSTVFYLFAETGDYASTPFFAYPFIFGDIISYKLNDPNRCIIIGRNTENSSATQYDGFSALHNSSNTGSFFSQTMIGHYMAGSWTDVGGSVMVGKHIDHGKIGYFSNNGALVGASSLNSTSYVAIGFNYYSNTFSYPNGPDNGLYLSPIWIHHGNFIRGYLKGLWAPCHDRPLNHNDTYNGTNSLSGKSLLVQSIPVYANNSASYAGQVHVETSSTWS